jgi:hypothetical protein
MEEYLRLQLQDLFDCLDLIEFFREKGLEVKRQSHPLQFKDGGRNPYFDFFRGGKTWTIGARAPLTEGKLSPCMVLFSCDRDGNVTTIPPVQGSCVMRPAEDWAQMTQRSPENAHKDQNACIREALCDAHLREDPLEREVQSLLNKISPDNLNKTVEILASIELHKLDELELVIGKIFAKALAEPFYCETYVDMVAAFCSRYPEFPPEFEGTRLLVLCWILARKSLRIFLQCSSQQTRRRGPGHQRTLSAKCRSAKRRCWHS